MELIAFGEAGCFGAADAAELLEYCARLLAYWVLGAAIAAELLGSDLPLKRLDVECCEKLVCCEKPLR